MAWHIDWPMNIIPVIIIIIIIIIMKIFIARYSQLQLGHNALTTRYDQNNKSIQNQKTHSHTNHP